MIETMFVQLIEISVTSGVIILGLCLLAPYLNKTYAAKCKYWIWLLLAVRLIIPINISLPKAPLEVNLPNTAITASDNVRPNPSLQDVAAGNPSTPDIAIVNPSSPDIVAAKPEQMPSDKTTQKPVTFLNVAVVIWFIGLITFLAYHVIGYFIFKRRILRWSSEPNDRRIIDVVQSTAVQTGCSRKVVPLISDAVSSPLLTGCFKPLLILPHESYSDKDLSLIIRHELTHCRRYDLWYKLLLNIANAVHWFNPAVYLMIREAGRDLELFCDDSIIKDMSFEERKTYAETILASILSEKMKKTALSTYFYGGPRTMKNRFVNILSTGKKHRGTFVIVAVLLCMVLFGGLIACKTDTGKNTADEANAVESNKEDDEAEKSVSRNNDAEKVSGKNDMTEKDNDNTKDDIGSPDRPDTSDDINIIDNITDKIYVNHKYGFSFDIPSDWENKYKIIETDKIISFVYSEYELDDKSYQEFFKIVVMSRDEYDKLVNDPPMTGKLLATKGEQVFVIYFPLDNAIMDVKKAEEYIQLCLSIEQAKERFSLTPDTGGTNLEKIGYILNVDTENNSIEFDEIEWITSDDTVRIRELNINPEDDMPNGFYIYNSSSDTSNYIITDETTYHIIDWTQNGKHVEVDPEDFIGFLNENNEYPIPVWITIDNNKVTSIREQYLP